MPGYSEKAQPYLDAIADQVFSDQDFRDWLLKGTHVEAEYLGSEALIDEQRSVRWAKKRTVQPFWANYWCGRDKQCSCRPLDSKALESDAIFFFKSVTHRVLAVHVEFKHGGEKFRPGQPEAYPLRAACFAKTHAERATLNAHDDWTTVIFCGSDALDDTRLDCFERIVTHREAADKIEAWPR